jgi:hypothetical protein
MSPDNFNFADIPPASTPDEQRFVELIRAVVRDENHKRDDRIVDAISRGMAAFLNSRRGGGIA